MLYKGNLELQTLIAVDGGLAEGGHYSALRFGKGVEGSGYSGQDQKNDQDRQQQRRDSVHKSSASARRSTLGGNGPGIIRIGTFVKKM